MAYVCFSIGWINKKRPSASLGLINPGRKPFPNLILNYLIAFVKLNIHNKKDIPHSKKVKLLSTRTLHFLLLRFQPSETRSPETMTLKDKEPQSDNKKSPWAKSHRSTNTGGTKKCGWRTTRISSSTPKKFGQKKIAFWSEDIRALVLWQKLKGTPRWTCKKHIHYIVPTTNFFWQKFMVGCRWRQLRSRP